MILANLPKRKMILTNISKKPREISLKESANSLSKGIVTAITCLKADRKVSRSNNLSPPQGNRKES
jgi:hypothetical protein